MHTKLAQSYYCLLAEQTNLALINPGKTLGEKLLAVSSLGTLTIQWETRTTVWLPMADRDNSQVK